MQSLKSSTPLTTNNFLTESLIAADAYYSSNLRQFLYLILLACAD